jgi:Kelch motif
MTQTSYVRSAVATIALLLAGAIAASAASHWTLIFPTGIADTELAAHTAVYDPGTNSMIVFGGFDYGMGRAQTNAVLLLTHANGLGGTSNWTTLIANGAPSSPAARDLHTAVYDAANNRMIVFGGFNPDSGLLNDVWVLTNANGQGGTPAWSQLNPTGGPPTARFAHTAVYDAANNLLIIFGGNNEVQTFDDVWVLSNANGLGGTPAWTQLSPSGGPPLGVDGSSAVYDSAHNTMIVFAGSYFTQKHSVKVTNAVWTLSHANGLGGTPRWKNIVANGAAGSPAKRASHSAIYDAANNRMTIFGGESQGTSSFPLPDLADLWVLINANGLGGKPTWTKLRPTATGKPPSRRDVPTVVYDASNNRMILFAGEDYDAVYFSPWILTDANGLAMDQSEGVGSVSSGAQALQLNCDAPDSSRSTPLRLRRNLLAQSSECRQKESQ